jgi:hypothetical protein
MRVRESFVSFVRRAINYWPRRAIKFLCDNGWCRREGTSFSNCALYITRCVRSLAVILLRWREITSCALHSHRRDLCMCIAGLEFGQKSKLVPICWADCELAEYDQYFKSEILLWPLVVFCGFLIWPLSISLLHQSNNARSDLYEWAMNTCVPVKSNNLILRSNKNIYILMVSNY